MKDVGNITPRAVKQETIKNVELKKMTLRINKRIGKSIGVCFVIMCCGGIEGVGG